MHGLPIHETNRIIREQRAGDHPREGLDRCTCGAKYWDDAGGAVMEIFVYGTLRVHGGNNWLWSLSSEVIYDCTAHGQMWNVRGDRPIFPVVNFTKPGRVVGDLLVVDDPKEIAAVTRMEMKVGYWPLEIDVELPDTPATVRALAYHWPHDEHGVHIESGDWLAWARQSSVRADMW